MGLYDFGTTNDIDFQIDIYDKKIDVWQLANSGVRYNGFLFFASLCPDGFYPDLVNDKCVQCAQNCAKCTSLSCLKCKTNHQFDSNNNCISSLTPPPQFFGCTSISEENGTFYCKLCNDILKFTLLTQTEGCTCMPNYYLNKSSNECLQICGDGIRIQSECDDNNTSNNDGCNSQCQLQQGFLCDTSVNPTYCSCTQELFYDISSITKTDDKKTSALIILKPLNKLLPFQVLQKNFYTDGSNLSQLDLKLVLKQQPNEVISDLQFQLIKVENNEIWLSFEYNFTVEGLKAQILLNYSETRYLDTTQILNFTLIGQNQALKISQLQESYETVSQNMLVSVILSLLGLCLGLFLPKFIGLESIITMQLIFYSQLLVYDFQKWPIGFLQFNTFKVSTGYNEVFNLTDFSSSSSINKKYNQLTLHKTIVENFNINFIILVSFAVFFFSTNFIRQQQEKSIKQSVRQIKAGDLEAKQNLPSSLVTLIKVQKVGRVFYNVMSQLYIWCLLPLLSGVGAEFMINNNAVTVNQSDFTRLLIKLRVPLFLIASLIVFCICFNHFRNFLLSAKMSQKIQKRSQELIYKRNLFIYLSLMGTLIFFFNDTVILNIPISVICLIIHFCYSVTILVIKPYNQSLRIHGVSLHLNLLLYLVFLILINLINLIEHINDFIILCLGYFVLVCVYLLILLTIVRLYYEIRYGEGLQRKIQAERKKQAEEQKANKEAKLKQLALEKSDEVQKARDLNKYLIETQMKEVEKTNLLEWLEGKNWQQQNKEKYFYDRFDKKPLEWVKKKDKAEYEKRIKEQKQVTGSQQKEKKYKQEDPDYIGLTQRLRKNLEDKMKMKHDRFIKKLQVS